jgi:O-acetylhomoserine/O-acetylserine sulfhydrylase
MLNTRLRDHALMSVQDLIRISVGTEHIDDIIADFEQSFKASATEPEKKGEPANAEKKGDGEASASLSGST